MKHFSQKLIMTVAMLLSFLQASAYDFEANGLYFNITDATNHKVEVTKPGSEGEYSGEIDIPPTVTNEGTTYTVTSIGDWAFYDCSGLTSVTIPCSVTSIGDCAFASCYGLTSITIPSSVTSIEINAFGSCHSLTEINVDTGNRIYASVDGVLYNKTLTEIVLYPEGKPGTTFSIPNSVTTIGGYAFHCCSGLTSITIPHSVTSIGDRAFDYCSIKSVYCHWEEPIKCNDLFSWPCYQNGTLYVPKGCADKYKSTYSWSYFKNIEEVDYLGVVHLYG